MVGIPSIAFVGVWRARPLGGIFRIRIRICRPATPSSRPRMSLRDEVQLALGDGYLVERELGQGGMGTVFLARDLALERQVAVKALSPELAGQPQLRERFLRETRIVAGFSHPNIVPVHAVVDDGRLLLFVMGYVDGETLSQRVRRGGPLNAPALARMVQELAWALSYAHGRGVVHRDVKPDNVIIERSTGRALLTDFGTARATSEASQLTSLGEVVGTPHYMSPEQAAGEQVDGRSDLYALGVTAFFAATGRLPFDAPTTQAILAMQITQPAPLVEDLRPDLPLALSAAIDRCLAKEPDARFESGEALVNVLEPVRATAPVVAPAVRQFLAEGEQSLRALVIVGVGLSALIARLAATADADLAALVVVGLTSLLGLLRGLIVRARLLLKLGHRYSEVRAAAVNAAADRAAAHAALRADPEERHRRRRQRVVHLATLLVGLSLIWLTFSRLRSTNPDGSHSVGTLGTTLSITGLSLLGFTVVSALTEPGRTSPLQRLGVWLWQGPFGRIAFRLASRELPASVARAAVSQGSVVASPLDVLQSLPRASRRRLRSVRRGLIQLEAILEALRSRQRELDLALAEAHQTDPGISGAEPSGRRVAIVEELTTARRATAEQMVRLLESRDAVRLQLLRFRTGLGSPADVQRELDTALAVGTVSQASLDARENRVSGPLT